MEPTLPGSATAPKQAPALLRSNLSVPGFNPSNALRLSLPFVLTGVVSLLIGVITLLVTPDLLTTYHYNQHIIALTHLFTLGWITSIVVGAMYQLVPVALETRLHSERLGRWHFLCHLVGVLGLVVSFWIWNPKQAGHFGSVFALGIGLFVFNIGRTLAQVPRWNVIAGAICSALSWLVLTVLAGLYLVAGKCWTLSYFSAVPQMHAHAHAGVLGFFLMMTVGVSYKLVPMFTLSDIQSPGRAKWSVILLNLGLAGSFLGILMETRWKPIPAAIILAGLVGYGLEIRAILIARKRRNFDWALRYFITALCFLAPLSLLGWVLSWPTLPLTPWTGQLETAYGFTALIGVLTLAIMGMLYKIVPFLVWFTRYSGEIGRSKVPSLAEMFSSRRQSWSFGFFLAGFHVSLGGILLSWNPLSQAGTVLLGVSLGIFLANLIQILNHLRRPRPAAAALNESKCHPAPL